MDQLIVNLNASKQSVKDAFFVNNINECVIKGVETDNMIKYHWFYFKIKSIWMCRTHDLDKMREGDGLLSSIVFFKDKPNINTINKQITIL